MHIYRAFPGGAAARRRRAGRGCLRPPGKKIRVLCRFYKYLFLTPRFSAPHTLPGGDVDTRWLGLPPQRLTRIALAAMGESIQRKGPQFFDALVLKDLPPPRPVQPRRRHCSNSIAGTMRYIPSRPLPPSGALKRPDAKVSHMGD